MSKKLSEQNIIMMNIARKLFKPHMKEGSKYHIEIHPETKEMIQDPEHAPIFYAGIHRSMWEAAGFTWIMTHESTKMPYTVTGDNLLKLPPPFNKLKNKPLEYLAKKTGLIIFERPNGKSFSEIKRIKIETQETLKEHWLRGDDVVMFAGGGRAPLGIAKPYGDAGFQAAVEVAKQRKIYEVSFIVDYRSIRFLELRKFIKNHLETQGAAQNMKIKDWLNFYEKMDDLYVRVGPPLQINSDDNITYLRKYTYEQALNMSKILPENAMALGRYLSYKNNPEIETVDAKIKMHKELATNLENITETLSNHKELCEFGNEETDWDFKYLVRNAITPYKFPTLEDKAWSTHFTNFVRHHYEKIGLLKE